MSDNQKKYEEAAKETPATNKWLGLARQSRMRMKETGEDVDNYETGYMVGASFAEKDGFNAGIQKATDFINHTVRPYSCDQADFLVKELEKLRI